MVRKAKLKQCKYCGETKPKSEFVLGNQCRDCVTKFKAEADKAKEKEGLIGYAKTVWKNYTGRNLDTEPTANKVNQMDSKQRKIIKRKLKRMHPGISDEEIEAGWKEMGIKTIK